MFQLEVLAEPWHLDTAAGGQAGLGGEPSSTPGPSHRAALKAIENASKFS